MFTEQQKERVLAKVLERIKKVRTGKLTCWIWQGATRGKGYGYLWWNGKAVMAQRLVYEVLVGQLGNRQVGSTCDNPLCVNPKHLVRSSKFKRGLKEPIDAYL